jgi:PKD repeat protein
LASIAPGASGSIGWFTGTLTCAANATISNQQYRVTASDQAVTSTNGAAVSFTTISPTINVAFAHTPASLIGSGPVVFTGTVGTNGTPLTYSWAFGDGTTGTGLTASHSYTQVGTYTVTLTATDGCGFAQSATVNNAVTVYAPVQAAFVSSPVSGIAPVTAVFTNTSTGDFTSSLWNFGDGVTSTLLSPTHTYTSAGVYTVTLRVTGPGGTNTSTVTNAVTVYAPVHAAFTATPTTGTPPLTVNFSNTSTGDFTSSLWTFGDGVTSTLSNPTHVYSAVGTYTVTLSISGPGGTAAMTVSNAITVNNYRIMLPLVQR